MTYFFKSIAVVVAFNIKITAVTIKMMKRTKKYNTTSALQKHIIL